MEELSVSPEILKERATEITNKVAEITSILSNITTEVSKVPDSFEGRASSEFQEKYNTLTKSYEKFSEAMENYAAFLNKTAETYKEMDETIAQLANQKLD